MDNKMTKREFEWECITRTLIYKCQDESGKEHIRKRHVEYIDASKLILSNGKQIPFSRAKILLNIIKEHDLNSKIEHNNKRTENEINELRRELITVMFDQDKLNIEINLNAKMKDIIGKKGGGELGELVNSIKEINYGRSKFDPEVWERRLNVWDSIVDQLSTNNLKEIKKNKKKLNTSVMAYEFFPNTDNYESKLRTIQGDINFIIDKIEEWDWKIQSFFGSSELTLIYRIGDK